MTEASGLIAIDPPAGTGGAGSVGFPLPYTQVVVRRLQADGALGERCGKARWACSPSAGRRLARLSQPRTRSRRLRRRHSQHRRPRLHRCNRPHPHRGPLQGPDHPQWPQYRPADDRERDAAPPAVALAAAVGMPDAYAGELPVCYVALRPGAAVTEAELREHAEQTIAERPAWPNGSTSSTRSR